MFVKSDNVEEIRKFQRHDPENKKCADCGGAGPTYVCMMYGTFVCTICSALHREMAERVKGISVSEWSKNEVDFIVSRGNKKINEIYLAKVGSLKDTPPSGNSNIPKLREWLHQKYILKRWKKEEVDDSAFPTEKSKRTQCEKILKTSLRLNESKQLSFKPISNHTEDDKKKNARRRSVTFALETDNEKNKQTVVEMPDDRENDDTLKKVEQRDEQFVTSFENIQECSSPALFDETFTWNTSTFSPIISDTSIIAFKDNPKCTAIMNVFNAEENKFTDSIQGIYKTNTIVTSIENQQQQQHSSSEIMPIHFPNVNSDAAIDASSNLAEASSISADQNNAITFEPKNVFQDFEEGSNVMYHLATRAANNIISNQRYEGDPFASIYLNAPALQSDDLYRVNMPTVPGVANAVVSPLSPSMFATYPTSLSYQDQKDFKTRIHQEEAHETSHTLTTQLLALKKALTQEQILL